MSKTHNAAPSPAPAPAGSPAASLPDLWRERARILALSENRTIDDDLWDDLTDHAFALERAVLMGPIAGIADAITKLEAVHPSFKDGERGDGADADALAAVIDWLKGHRAATVFTDAPTAAQAYGVACIRLHGLVEHHRTHGPGSATAEDVLADLFRRSAEVERAYLAMRSPTEATTADAAPS